jgi:hypothetical protein
MEINDCLTCSNFPENGEAEFRAIFTGLDENGQDRLLDTARALFFAQKARSLINRADAWKQESGAGRVR